MKSVFGLATIAAVAFAQPTDHEGPGPDSHEGGSKPHMDVFSGSYEFEIMGSPYRMYICNNPESMSMYWAVANLANIENTNEYTEVVGRDSDGIKFDGKHTYTASCSIYRLFGERHLEGYYRLVFDDMTGEYTLHERYPELEDHQTGAEDEEIWNTYTLTKISPGLVGNPQMMGYQCLHPYVDEGYELPLPSLWKSDLSSANDRLYDNILLSKNPIYSCWKYDDVFGNTHLHGNIYAPEEQWDGALILFRWDDFTNPDHCYVGSMFAVMLEEDLALVSYQCENTVTGRQHLMHLQKMTGGEVCPFEVDYPAVLTKREHSISTLNK
eukprot:119381_1